MKTEYSGNAPTESGGSVPAFLETHYNVQELAAKWGACPNTVSRWFEGEPDVLKISIGFKRCKQHRVSLRIPQSVAQRVYQQHCGGR